VIPTEIHRRKIERDEAQRELLRLAARSHGVGTAGDLADYYRMPIREARRRIAELIERSRCISDVPSGRNSWTNPTRE
jgi:uncharacterized protein